MGNILRETATRRRDQVVGIDFEFGAIDFTRTKVGILAAQSPEGTGFETSIWHWSVQFTRYLDDDTDQR